MILMELEPQISNRARGFVETELACPWCEEAVTARVQVNVENHRQGGGGQMTTWYLATANSRLLSSHACAGPSR